MNNDDNINDEVKKSRLNANSEIYNKNRSDRLEPGQFKEMSAKDKFLHFKEYYLPYILIVLVLVLVSVYVFITIQKKDHQKDTFYCAMLDGLQLNHETMASLPADFSEYLEANTDYAGNIDKETTYFETFYATLTDGIRLDSFYDKRKFDVFILRDTAFKNYCSNKTLIDLSSILSEEMLNKLESRLIYVIDKDTGSHIPYGILLDDIKYNFQDGAGEPVDPPILAIPICTTRIEAAIHFIEFFLSE